MDRRIGPANWTNCLTEADRLKEAIDDRQEYEQVCDGLEACRRSVRAARVLLRKHYLQQWAESASGGGEPGRKRPREESPSANVKLPRLELARFDGVSSEFFG